MRAAQAGDQRAYEQLLREIVPFVRALARRYCAEPPEIEEIVQDTLLTVHRVRHTYDPQRPFMPWLAAVAARRSIDALRRRRRIARHELSAEDETFADPATNTSVEAIRATEELHMLLQCLPVRQREALESLKLKDMSLAEASAASGQSVGALKVNVHRAIKTLRRLLAAR
jgi:RNA polymerase sigma-70 factor, ECF subfamily